jgi:hypothetical protein
MKKEESHHKLTMMTPVGEIIMSMAMTNDLHNPIIEKTDAEVRVIDH